MSLFEQNVILGWLNSLLPNFVAFTSQDLQRMAAVAIAAIVPGIVATQCLTFTTQLRGIFYLVGARPEDNASSWRE
jgi:hypothetical protein